MSAVTTRPRVRAISYTAPVVTAVEAFAATPVTVSTLAGLLECQGMPLPLEQAPTATGAVASAIYWAPMVALPQTDSAHAAIAEHRGVVLDAVAAAGFVAPIAAIAAPVRRLSEAASVADLAEASTLLVDTLTREHRRVMSAVTVDACRTASEAAGFSTIEVRQPRLDAATRIVASNDAGHLLVSELQGDDGGLTMTTEVIGVTDGSCHDVLDVFDRALERHGLVAEARRSCHLADPAVSASSGHRRVQPAVAKVVSR